eukprot:TRINITY_DN1954_c2_g1_i1.p1 TRINITY_DN1954_c2_g1~~TRINITY_DN1954_c2_g1_i1.p1  ORF type:complete len:465 (+),score=133.97 TRINITY_DN1954_c2_g1_i1:106-1500(+)
MIGAAAGLCAVVGAYQIPERLRARWHLPEVVQNSTNNPAEQHLTVPLDHFNKSDTRTHTIRYWVQDGKWSKDPSAPLFVGMPGEGAAGNPGPFVDSLTESFSGVRVHTEHRFFGKSTPSGDASTTNLAYLSVEQNLADIAALATHVKAAMGLTGPVVATGGSYSGASASWVRAAYPGVVSASVAESGPTHAIVNFYEYDRLLHTALQSPDPSCAASIVAVMTAFDTEWSKGRSEMEALKEQFGASALAGAVGDTDFLYLLGDSVANLIQYGRKATVCDAAKATLPAQPTSAELLQFWADFVKQHGPSPSEGCFYNSTCMRDATDATAGANSGRSWYWLKCTELAYLQTAPPQQPRVRPSALTTDRLLAQCQYIFGSAAPSVPRCDAFNKRFGGAHPEKVNTTHVMYLSYSDDPWFPAQPQGPLPDTLAYVFTKCDGCAHCGAGVPSSKLQQLEEMKEKQLRKWI